MRPCHKLILKGPYFPKHSENRMISEGSVSSAREAFIKQRFRNLDYLLESRYAWMNNYIKDDGVTVEVGAGAGFSEINTSLATRALLRLMRHEGWSYDVDVFDKNSIVNDPSDLWSANCAVSELLFKDIGKFESVFNGLKVELDTECEFLLFPLSGGVISKTAVPELPFWFLNLARKIDQALTSVFPSIFAMGRSVVVRRMG